MKVRCGKSYLPLTVDVAPYAPTLPAKVTTSLRYTPRAETLLAWYPNARASVRFVTKSMIGQDVECGGHVSVKCVRPVKRLVHDGLPNIAPTSTARVSMSPVTVLAAAMAFTRTAPRASPADDVNV